MKMNDDLIDLLRENEMNRVDYNVREDGFVLIDMLLMVTDTEFC